MPPCWGLRNSISTWEEVKLQQEAKNREPNAAPAAATVQTPSGELPGLPPSLEASLKEARGQSPAALKLWIEKYRPYVKDPRLASIELDYVVLIGGRDYVQARKILHAVQERTPTNSPVYMRIQQLRRNYP